MCLCNQYKVIRLIWGDSDIHLQTNVLMRILQKDFHHQSLQDWEQRLNVTLMDDSLFEDLSPQHTHTRNGFPSLLL